MAFDEKRDETTEFIRFVQSLTPDMKGCENMILDIISILLNAAIIFLILKDNKKK